MSVWASTAPPADLFVVTPERAVSASPASRATVFARDVLGRDASRSLVSLRGVGKVYPARRGHEPVAALEGVDLEVPAGRTLALVGHTGCGKTTLTNLVPRFYDVSDGRVLIDGLDVRDAKLDDLRRHIGIVNQDPFLFSATIADNIRFGRPDANDAQVRDAAERAQATSFIEALPEGYETVVGERGLTLSGGQRQRVAIARALVVDPQILILDDATSSVDAETEFRIRQALVEVMKGRTTFIIAHRPSTISLAEEIVVMDKGRIVERGAHRELIARDTLYRRMFGAAELEGTTLDTVQAFGDDERAARSGDRVS
jgi:ABC-type multidrug transport system fused ATPase/permease subunit